MVVMIAHGSNFAPTNHVLANPNTARTTFAKHQVLIGAKRKIAKDREVERGVISLIPIPLMITSPFLLLIFDPGLQLDVTLLKSLTVKIWNSWKVCKALIKVNISLSAKVGV